jgi:hypothetical protein
MFARMVECTAKQGKVSELNNSIRNEIMPVLQTQPGFVDEIILVSSNKVDQLVALSFWNSTEDAGRYEQEQYPQILRKLQPVLKARPRVKTFTVDWSTIQKLATGQLA